MRRGEGERMPTLHGSGRRATRLLAVAALVLAASFGLEAQRGGGPGGGAGDSLGILASVERWDAGGLTATLVTPAGGGSAD
jgi:hypothetical protein